MPFEFLLGLRYTKPAQKNLFTVIIAMISILGIAVGILALIVIISVMNGFQKELRSRILGSTEHMKITTADERLSKWRDWAKQIEAQPEIVGIAPYIKSEVMVIQGERVQGSIVQGVLPGIEGDVSNFGKHMVTGGLNDLKPGSFNIILGEDLARLLNVNLDNEVTLVSPFAMITPAGLMPRVKKFKVAGIFKIDMFEYDSRYAMVHLDDAAKFFRYGDQVSGLRVRLENLFRAPAVAAAVAPKFPDLTIRDWTQENVAYFRALKTEKVVMTVILTLIILVAVFNIVSMLVMLVTNKKSDIAILRTVGATQRSLMAVFMIQGSFVGIIGTLIGIVGGVLIAGNIETIVPFLETVFGAKIFPDDIYYISEVPSEMHGSDILLIGAISMVLSVLATVYPAWQAAHTQPAEVLRYDW